MRWAAAAGGALTLHGALLVGAAIGAASAPQPHRPAALVWLDLRSSADADRAEPAPATELPASAAHVVPRARATRSKPARAQLAASLPRPAVGHEASLALHEQSEPEAAGAPAEVGSIAAETSHAGSLASAGRGGSAGVPGRDAATPQAAAFPPGLLAFGDPCRGFYPSGAQVDHGEVRMIVRVGRDGRTHESEVVAELPARQGFGGAARACVERLRFRPARTVDGNAIPGQAVLALSFDRS